MAAGGVDRAVHVFSVPSLEPASNSSTEILTLHGHTSPISSIISNSSGTELISADWNGQINIYNIPAELPTEHQIPAEPSSYLPGQKKRRKLQGNITSTIPGLTDGDVGGGGWRRIADGVMRGCWDKNGKGTVWSAGWDGSVRGWDVQGGAGAVVRVNFRPRSRA